MSRRVSSVLALVLFRSADGGVWEELLPLSQPPPRLYERPTGSPLRVGEVVEEVASVSRRRYELWRVETDAVTGVLRVEYREVVDG
jgi:hypothetical protein